MCALCNADNNGKSKWEQSLSLGKWNLEYKYVRELFI